MTKKIFAPKERCALGRSLFLAALACALAGPPGATVATLTAEPEEPELAGENRGRAPQSFWEADVWEDPNRPFLYYGEDPEPAKKAPEKPRPRYDDFSRFTTVEALRKEYDRRKDAAIMHPEIDWTATHPLVNSVAGTLRTERDGLNRKLLQTVAKEAGLLWIADADNPVSHAAAPLVRAFAKTHGFSLLVVEKKGRPIGFDPVVFAAPKPDLGIGAKLGAADPATLPALFLVPDPKTPYPTLREIVRKGGALRFATGAVSVTKMGESLLFLLVPDLEKFPKALPSERAAALRTEWSNASAYVSPKAEGSDRSGGPESSEAPWKARAPDLPPFGSAARPWSEPLPPDPAAGVAPFDRTVPAGGVGRPGTLPAFGP